MATTISQDVRFALRQLAKSPGFAAVAVLTLAFGIAGATTMFGFLQAVVRYGQPTVPEPEALARLFTGSTAGGDARGPVSLTDYRRWVATARLFETLAAYFQRTESLRTSEGADEVTVLAITPSYLSLLKTPAVIGHLFTGDEARASDGRVALLSERAWHTRFEGGPSVLGRSLELDGKSYTVVGVLAERLGLVMPPTDLFVPLSDANNDASVMVIGRRRGAADWAQVGAEMNAIGAGGRKDGLRVLVTPILDDAGFRARALWLLAVGPAVLVLLIGCGNVASLLLVRAVSREREIAVRLALGASRRRLAAQLLTEGWTLAATAGVLGVLLARVGLFGIGAVVPPSAGIQLELDPAVLCFAGIATLITPLVFAAAPLLHSLRVDLSGALRAALHKPLFGVGRYHVRDLFAILEVGLAVAMVVFAFMFLSLFRAMRWLDLNFDRSGLLVVEIRSPERGTDGETTRLEMLRRLREVIAAIPGIAQMTLGDAPLGGQRVRVGRRSAVEITARRLYAGPAYFETLRLPITRGRGFNDGDVRGSTEVAVVNESLASRLWPGADPLGQTLQLAADGAKRVTVVGVSKDAVRLGRLAGLNVQTLNFRYSLFRPWAQEARPGIGVIARVAGEPTSFFPRLREAVESTDRELHLGKVMTMATATDPTDGEAPLPIYLLAGFGGLALLLATVGVFGVMSQLVDERRAELGVRLALGASPRGLVRLVVQDGLLRAGLGAALGLLCLGVGVLGGFTGLLGAVAPDPWLWIGVVAVVALTAAAACYLPARRAAKIDPMMALRQE
jgi:predicted permease